MKTKLYNLLSKPYSVLIVILISILLALLDRNLGYFFGLGVAIFILWQKKWDWSFFGIGQRLTLRTILNSVWISMVYFIVMGVIDGVLQHYLGANDLSSLDNLRGEFTNYAFMMVIMWVFAAFGEEFLFQGYYMKGLANLFGGSKIAWGISAVLIATYFGISHGYQGLSGVIGITIGTLFVAFLFYKNRTNLLLLVLIHGIYDSIWLTLIYLNYDIQVSRWFEGLIFS